MNPMRGRTYMHHAPCSRTSAVLAPGQTLLLLLLLVVNFKVDENGRN